FIESPVYPCRVAQSVLGHERVIGKIHAGDPAVLVVHGQELDGERFAVAAPGNSPGAAIRIVGHHGYGALLRLRVLAAGSIRRALAGAVLVANRLQRVIADARKTT